MGDMPPSYPRCARGSSALECVGGKGRYFLVVATRLSGDNGAVPDGGRARGDDGNRCATSAIKLWRTTGAAAPHVARSHRRHPAGCVARRRVRLLLYYAEFRGGHGPAERGGRDP